MVSTAIRKRKHLSRSTWACELKFNSASMIHNITVTLHVSVWVEIFIIGHFIVRLLSRSTWACELKLSLRLCWIVLTGHAPRERVSWNAKVRTNKQKGTGHAPRERVSWNDVLFINALVHIRHAPRERVSWNVWWVCNDIRWHCHAPRERVSWNITEWKKSSKISVTLHVSVWVEMTGMPILVQSWESHAPRERVSWNYDVPLAMYEWNGHAPRERVSWNL